MSLVKSDPEREDLIRVVAPQEASDERDFDAALRPRWLSEFVGQPTVKEQFGLLIDGAKGRGEPVDHVLLSGPPSNFSTSVDRMARSSLSRPRSSTSNSARAASAEASVMRPSIRTCV